MPQHLAVEADEAVEPDILAIERAALLVPARLVMDRRIVHEGLVLGGELGALVEALAHIGGAEFEQCHCHCRRAPA